MNCLTYLVSGFILLISILYIYLKYKLTYWSRKGVKTPPVHFIFGNMKDTITFKKPPGVVLQEIYQAADPNDPYIGFYIFHKPGLMMRDINLIKQIMVKDFDIFSDRIFGGTNEKDSVGLVNLLSINQPKWKYLRSKMTPSLTGQKLKRMVPLMFERGDPMLKFIDKATADDDGWKHFELKTLSSKYTTDVISSLAFGITTNSFDENDVAFWEAGQKILSGLKRNIILMLLFFVPEVAPFIEPITKPPAEFFRRIFWDSMNTREKVGNVRGDMIDSFLALKNGPQSEDFKFEGDNLLAQAVAFYVAGFEASSTAIAFAIYELACHPEYEERLYEEIKKILAKGEELSMDNINEMTFLDAIVTETLRLYPPLPQVDRVALRDYNLPGTNLTIKKGTSVFVSINGINRDSRYFSEPTVFNPLRTRNEQYDFTGSFAFGIGPRSCVGQRLGTLITKVAVITLVMNYKIILKSDKENLLNPVSIFTNAADGLYVHLRKRINKETDG